MPRARNPFALRRPARLAPSGPAPAVVEPPPPPPPKPIPAGRFKAINGLPCLTAGVVAIDWVNPNRQKGAKECLHLTLRRQDIPTRTWAMWDGGTVATRMPADTDQETLRQASLHLLKHLYWPIRDFKGWQPVLAKLAEISPNHFPDPTPPAAVPPAPSSPGGV